MSEFLDFQTNSLAPRKVKIAWKAITIGTFPSPIHFSATPVALHLGTEILPKASKCLGISGQELSRI